MNKKRILSILALSFLFLPGVAETRVERLRAILDGPDRNHVFVALHRGAWREYPENSISGIRGAIAMGADMIEIDASRTKDGKFVLNHDNKLDRVTNGKGAVEDHTLAEIKELFLKEFSGGEGAKLTSERVPTLEEALEAARGQILVNIDRSCVWPEEIAAIVKRLGMENQVVYKGGCSVLGITRDFASGKGPFADVAKPGSYLFMPIVHADTKGLDDVLAAWDALTHPPKAYEICWNKSDEPFLRLERKLSTMRGSPRFWANDLWDSLNNGRSCARAVDRNDPDGAWGWMLEHGVTMIQTDRPRELLAYLAARGRRVSETARPPVRVGIIGTDTWHAREFTRLLNVETNRTEFAGFKVTAAYRWGSRDIPGSLREAEDYIPQLKAWGVLFVDSIADLLKRVDVVLLETNDGREHLAQAEEVFRSGKPVFIDKPVAESSAAVEALDRLAKKYGRRWYSSSGLRFQRAIRRARLGDYGKVRGAQVLTPAPTEPHHSRYFWYGIHGASPLFAVMGPDCVLVRTVVGADEDLVIGTWKDGRIGTVRMLRSGTEREWGPGMVHGGQLLTEKGAIDIGDYEGYEELLKSILLFFRTGVPPVDEAEILAVYRFLDAAVRSADSNAAPVSVLRK